ncbi:hypothetical protein FB45DRAFT_1030576 [Roridomyces roridus]|uniref:F-box domain-containing protein n=1 Tax=Roridomyces roridus TaxID=1738132 RepID=A0AAD7FJW0_9AGAR|nr:hypothetical protein FB45DRAFT_1030576 [Roridomyces roridus]
MHHALEIDEIVQCICGQIAQAGPSEFRLGVRTEQYPNRCGDLFHLAQTCRTFLDPALDSLWSFQGTLLHLLRTMLPDLWYIMEISSDEHSDASSDDGSWTEDDTWEISFRRTPRASDWDWFTFYAHRLRITRFVIINKHSDVRSETSFVYDILATKFPHGTIFPRLGALDWSFKDPQLFHHIHLFLSPKIKRLHIQSDHIAHFTILETLSSQLPGLKNVTVGGVHPDSYASPFVCALDGLETLVIWNLDLTAFDHLSRLPRLRYLWVMSNTPRRLPPRPKDVPCFPALRVFECESIEATPNLLGQTGGSLVEFYLSSRGWATCPTKQILQELYTALASSCTHSLLGKITVEQAWDAHPIMTTQLDLYVVSGDDLKRLFCFRNIVHVWLAHCIAVDLDDAVALEMARAWPRIEVLALPCDNTHRMAPRMTLEGVYAFAQHCPVLRRLSVLFDATAVPKFKLASGETTRRRGSQDTLARFEVAYSPIGTKKMECRRVATFLRSIFPALHCVEPTKPDSTTGAHALAMHGKAWMKVAAELA